jgi:hypothetical protein
LVRRFSFNHHKQPERDSQQTRATLRRSDSMRSISIPHVTFKDHVRITTIYPINEIPYDVRNNLWMSRDELMMCMHDAAIARMQGLDECDESEEFYDDDDDDFVIGGVAERRNSNTSVIDDDDSFYVTPTELKTQCRNHRHIRTAMY